MNEQNKLKAGDFCEGDLGEGGVLIDIYDPSLPNDLREMACTYDPPARFVVKQGEGEYDLFSEDGEELDLVWDCF